MSVILSRRRLLTGLVAAPLVASATNLMPLRGVVMAPGFLYRIAVEGLAGCPIASSIWFERFIVSDVWLPSHDDVIAHAAALLPGAYITWAGWKCLDPDLPQASMGVYLPGDMPGQRPSGPVAV